MRRHRLPLLLSLISALAFAQNRLPADLSDQDFWTLSESLSEPSGYFQSDNLLSNELVFTRIVPPLIERAKPGGVYLGVGPEQNFTYMAAIRPRIAFITDIRRGNLHVQLMYKALFELSADRADFVALLFTKPRPAGLTASSTVTEIMNAFWDVHTGGEAAYAANLDRIVHHLTKTRSLPLSVEDRDGIARVYRTFFWYGPSITWAASTRLQAASAGTTYWQMMTQGDTGTNAPGFLGSEEKFAFLKDLQRRNLVIPVVGNFSGPKALRGVGAYVRSRGATVTAFYLSNVESYLSREGTWPAFCANVASMPLDEHSVFIRPSGAGGTLTGRIQMLRTLTGANGTPVSIAVNPPTPPTPPGPTPTGSSGVVPMMEEVKGCAGPLHQPGYVLQPLKRR